MSVCADVHMLPGLLNGVGGSGEGAGEGEI